MREVDIRKTQFTVTDLLSWQREGSLNLTPPFQRRSVWKPDAKSFFLDTIARGLPIPIIYLRQRVDLQTQRTLREVVDGQQRLRTLFSYIDPTVLRDFDPKRDSFRVRAIHNKDLSESTFNGLPTRLRERILSYEISTHVLPSSVEDREVLEIFARLNATGEKLNQQELRNAKYFGELKTLMYRLAYEQLERWREWEILTDDQISRMREVELTSDLALNMVRGLAGKTQKTLDDFYGDYDDSLPDAKELATRFERTMDQIDNLIGVSLADSVYRSEVYFFTLFVYLYDRGYGLGSSLEPRKAKKVRDGLGQDILNVGKRFENEQVPKDVLDAVQRASSDIGRRRTRLDFMKKQCDA